MSEQTAKAERQEERKANTIYCPNCTRENMPPGLVTQIAPNSPAFGCLDCGTVFIPEQIRQQIRAKSQQRIIVPKMGGLIKAAR